MAIHVRDSRGGNWSWFHNAVLDTYGKQLGPYGLAVYMTLCRHAGEDQSTWVGQRAIGEEIGATRQKVNIEIGRLKELGLIAVEEQRDERGRTTNIYTLLPPPSTPVIYTDKGVIQDDRGSHPGGQPLSSERTAMMNKTQLTRPMEQGDAPDDGWKAELADTMTPQNYRRWIAPLELVELANAHAVLMAPNAGVADYVQNRLSQRVAEALGVERLDITVEAP